MSLDILQTILNEEQRAASALQEAQQDANDIVKNAESSVLEKERKSAVDKRALYQKLMEEKRVQTERDLAEQRLRNQMNIQGYIKSASGNLKKAVDYILDEVLDGRR